MRTTLSRIAAAAAALMLILIGCQAEKKLDDTSHKEKADARGRYTEQVCSLPEMINNILYIGERGDHIMEMIASTDEGAAAYYTSQDGGLTWDGESPEWMEPLKGKLIRAAQRGPNGKYVIFFSSRDEGQATQEQEAGENTEYLLEVDETGKTEVYEAPFYVGPFEISETGAIIINESYSRIHLLDPKTLDEILVIETGKDEEPITGMAVKGDTLFVASDNEILTFSLSTGGQGDTISVPGGFNENTGKWYSPETLLLHSLDISPNDSAISFCDRTGIYRKALDGPLLEQSVDGTLVSLSVPSMLVRGFIAKSDGSYLVLYNSSFKNVMMNYRFDPELSVEPETTLNVYSIADNKTLRQAVGNFQRENPTVRVDYTVASDGENEVPVTDLIRSLNTELLAGKGPDVLIADNLPYESYIEKGVLLDMTSLVSERIADGSWLEKASSLKTDGGQVFVAPTRFTVPLLLIAKDTGVTDLESLIGWLEEIKSREGQKYEILFSPRTPKALLRLFYPVCSPAWLGREEIHEDLLAQYLSQVKRLSDLTVFPDDEDFTESLETRKDLGLDSLVWYGEKSPCSSNIAIDWNGVLAAISMTREKDGVITGLPGKAENVFIPKGLIGVNANNDQKDLSLAFVETVLSEPVQKARTKDGFPISKAAFSALSENPFMNESQYPFYRIDNENYDKPLEYRVSWPPQEQVQEMLDWFNALNTPCVVDESVVSLLQEESAPFFKGDITAQEAASAIQQKLKLQQSE